MLKRNRVGAFLLASALCLTPLSSQSAVHFHMNNTITASAESISDMPADFQYAADWIWQNRIDREKSTVRRNTIFDQIVAGKGTINYVVKWQSYRTVTYEQRQKFEKMLSDCINAWNDWLAGYENWPYDHIDVKIVGWAVLDKNSLLDLHDDEVVYTEIKSRLRRLSFHASTISPRRIISTPADLITALICICGLLRDSPISAAAEATGDSVSPILLILE